jgi:ubiquitin-protein ligase
MDKQRILKEAQKIAAKFSFWMVSGNISHLFGYVYETPEGKYELEIKFNEDFPYVPPDLEHHKEIKELLGDFQLETVDNWAINSSVVDIIIELKSKIQQVLLKSKKEKSLSPTSTSEVSDVDKDSEQIKAESLQDRDEGEAKTPEKETKTEKEAEAEKREYLTPDLNEYPPDFDSC